MKYIIILYIAFGFVLSLVVGIKYTCHGPEMFPDYYGCPFVFKQKSLASSMEYYYSISGLVINTAIWSLLLYALHRAVLKLLRITGNKQITSIFYKGIVVVLLVFSTLNIAVNSIMLGRGFKEGLNYWYMDMDKEAEIWGMECEGEWKVLIY